MGTEMKKSTEQQNITNSSKIKPEQIDLETGVIEEGEFNVARDIITRRPDGTLRIQQDFSACPSLAEQHTGHLSDINWLMQKYKPDELAAYLAARTQYRQEIKGHDFSREPDLQEAKNAVYHSREAFKALPDDIKNQFANHLEFLKFIDNPQNVEKMIKMGILTKKEIENIQIPDDANNAPASKSKTPNANQNAKGENNPPRES